MSTLYKILHITETADQEEVKRAYRELARKYHPDTNNSESSELMFRKISEAYSTLSNREKRERYDQMLGIKKESLGLASDGPPPFPFDGTGEGPEESGRKYDRLNKPLPHDKDYSRKEQKKSQPKESHPEEGFLDKITKVFIKPEGKKKSHSATYDRSELDIRGERIYQFTINALESLTGTIRELALKSDDAPRLIKVKLPAGVCHGDLLRVKMETDAGEERLPIRVSIVDHEYVEREGKHIIVKIPITMGEALMGVEFEVPTMTTPVKVKIPPGWDCGQKLRIKGRGVVRGDEDPAGDLYVQLIIANADLPVAQVEHVAKVLDEGYVVSPRNKIPTAFSPPEN